MVLSGIELLCLYDSGVNVFAINRKYVPKSVYTGKYIHCHTFSGRVERFAQCRMTFKMSFYIGVTLLCELRKPTADIVVGQLSGVKRCTHLEIAWYKKNGITSGTILARCSDKQITHSPPSQDYEAHAVTIQGEQYQHDQRL